MVQSGSGEPIPVGVTLGNSTTVNLAAGTTTLGTIQVVGSSVVTAVDVTSTDSATNITAQEIERLPVERQANSVALLAAGVASGRAWVRAISLSVSAVAHHVSYITGLNDHTLNTSTPILLHQ